jgi:signal transduction histidine kinase
MPRSLGGRLVGAFAILALAIVLTVGGALFVVLRGLHHDATLGTLSDVATSVLPQVRESIGTGQLRGTIEEIRQRLAEQPVPIELLLVSPDGTVKSADGTFSGRTLLDDAVAVGETVQGEIVAADGKSRWLYAATAIRRQGAATPRGVAFVTLDRSGAFALADVGRTIPVVALVILLIGTPIAIALSRSVTGPLRRLADTAADIPAGRAAALPLSGPAEVRELTGTFNAMTAELDATRQRERDLLANLRHDLRTPLTVIAGFATALRDGTAQGEAAEAAAKAIEEEAERLERLVAQIGAIERIGSGDDAIRPEMLDARLLIADTVARFRARATASGVDLAPAEPDATEPLALAADRLALERMLGNLVENAISAASSGGSGGSSRTEEGAGGEVRIAAALERAPDGTESIRIDVLDNGPGFPDGSAGRAFERFWRGDPARAGSGSGLGLAIVRELALAHGGSAHAQNRAEGGARVGVTLPRVPWPAQPRASDGARPD